MKKRNNRFLAGTLAGLMMLTMLPVTALAAQEDADGDAASDTPNNIVNVVSDGENGQQAVNNDVNIAANGGNENAQKSADDSNGGSAATAAPAPQEGEAGGSGSGNTADTTPAAEQQFVAKIGTQTYESLDKAIEAVQGDEVIEVGEDCTLTVGTIEKAVVINGNGYTISVPEQGTDNHALKINALLTFNNAKVEFPDAETSAYSWAFTMNQEGELTLDNGSTCIIKHQIIDARNYATINVLNGSKLKVLDAGWTAIHGADEEKPNVQYSIINIKNGSEVVVDNPKDNGVANGIINCEINVENSALTVTNCENQGLVSCRLTLDDSQAEISHNDMGMTGKSGTDVLTMKNSSTLTMEDNRSAGIFLWGGNVDVQDGTTLTITGTGNNAKEEVLNDYYIGALAINMRNPYRAKVNFADNATVKLIDNAVSAIRNGGEVYVGAGTVIMNNGSKASYGGGIQNYGKITVSDGAKLYNNHAQTAGDDIYSTTYVEDGASYNPPVLSFAPVGKDWVLDDCSDPIVGWYHDGKEKRWNGDGEGDAYYADEYTVGKEAVSDALALKAAHGQFCNVTYEVTGDVPSDAGAVPAAAKVKKGGSYTVAPVQTTSQSRYTFSGWRINGVGDVVTEIKDIQQDVKLIGVWTRRSSGGGGGSHKPTVTIPDDVPTGLNGDDHFAYIVGYPNGNVEPNGNITRAEVATIFFRLLTEEVRTANSTQSNSLSDVTRGQWFNHAVSTLSSMGIVKGHNDGTFAPNAPITRAEFAAIAARFDDKNTDTSSKFTDIASHWAKNEIGIAANKGWINGYPDGTFRPNQYITRAEAMTLVNRVLNRLPENSSDLLDSMIKWPDNSDASAWYYLAVQEATNSHAYSDKSKDDKYEKWTTIRDARDWTELEK